MKVLPAIFVVAARATLAACGSGNAKFGGSPPPPDTHNEWTWVSGANVAGQPGTYGTQGTTSVSNIPGARGQSFSWIDSSGNFWLFGGGSAPTQSSYTLFNDLWKYSAGQWTWVGGSSMPNQAGIMVFKEWRP
jgi:hypothetical protein